MTIRTLTLLGAAAVLHGADPFVGVWEENTAKSPAWASLQASKFERDGEFLRNANGPINYKFKVDGQSYPIAGSAAADSGVWKRTGRTYVHDAMKGGKLAYRNEITIAPDGKTRTYRQTTFHPDGKVRTVADSTHDRVGGAIDNKEPLIGEWRPRRRTVIREGADGVLEFSLGSASFSAKPDGTDYPVTSANADTVSLQRVSSTHLTETRKKAGKTVMTRQWMLAPDSKSLVSTDGRIVLIQDRAK